MIGWLKNLMGEKRDDGGLGGRGENLAAKYLRGLGYTIILRNFRCRLGEIDIIARDGRTIVFVEVKTRADDATANPHDHVDAIKQQHLTRVGQFYMSRYGTPRPPARFDVVSIVWPSGRDPQIEHIPNAFEPTF
jgi:putative endonuclease